MNRFVPTKVVILCVVLLLIAFAAMLAQLNATFGQLRAFAAYALSPVYEVPLKVFCDGSALAQRLKSIISIHQENDILKQKIERVDVLAAQLQSALAENDALKKVLHVQQDVYPQSLSAQVFAYDPSQTMQAVWIDRGSLDGVTRGAAVLAVEGGALQDHLTTALVGRVWQVQRQSSKVLLLSDPISSVAVMLDKNGEVGLVQGQGNFAMSLEYLNQLAQICSGDYVVTSGQGGVFPPGLMVARVEKVMDAHSGFRRALLRPEVRLSALHNVLVLVNKNEFKK